MESNEEKISIVKQSVRGGILNICAAVVSKISGLLFYILILRFITPAEGGVYFLSMAFACIIAVIMVLGVGDSLARFIPYYEGTKKQDKIKSLVFTAFVSFLIFSILILFLAHLVSDVITTNYNKELGHVLTITLFISIALSLNSILICTLLGLKKFGECALYSAALPISKIVFVVGLFLLSTKNLTSVLNATFWSVAIVDIIMLISIFIKLAKFPGKFTLLEFKDILETASYGIATAFNQFSSFIMGYTDTLVLGYYISSAIIGAYNSVMSIARTAMHTISSQIFFVLTSMLSHLYGTKSEIFGPLASNAARWSAYITIPFVVLTLFFAKEFMEIFFPIYVNYYWLFYIIVPGIAIGILSYPARSALSAVGKTDLLFKSSFIGVIFNLVLNLILIPIYGVCGAAIATAISYTISEIIALFYAGKFAKFELPRMILKTTIPTITMLIALLLSYGYLFNFSARGMLFESIGVALASSVSLFIYFILLIKLGGLNKTDYTLIEKIIQIIKNMANQKRKLAV